MEAALVFRHAEKRQLLDFCIGIIVDAVRPDGPVLGTDRTVFVDMLSSFFEMLPELFGRLLGEYLMESHADGVYFLLPDRVFLLAASLEVHVYLIFWDGACHQLTVAAEDIASFGFYADTVFLQTVSHFRPILFLCRHDIEGLADDSESYDGQHYGNRHIARYHLVVFEFTHDGTLILVLI